MQARPHTGCSTTALPRPSSSGLPLAHLQLGCPGSAVLVLDANWYRRLTANRGPGPHDSTYQAANCLVLQRTLRVKLTSVNARTSSDKGESWFQSWVQYTILKTVGLNDHPKPHASCATKASCIACTPPSPYDLTAVAPDPPNLQLALPLRKSGNTTMCLKL